MTMLVRDVTDLTFIAFAVLAGLLLVALAPWLALWWAWRSR